MKFRMGGRFQVGIERRHAVSPIETSAGLAGGLNINPDDKQEYQDRGLAPEVNLGYAIF